jgi:hypothetical protein
MLTGKRIVLYELNEVPRRVLEDFVQRRPATTLARLLREGQFFETVAEDQGVLSPWITWPTLHRGVSNEKHCISDFGQDLAEVNDEYPTFTSLLSAAGVRVGVFGSLHSYPLPPDPGRYAFYVPDTFANGPECFPETLSAFQEFNLSMVDTSGRNVSRSVPLGPAASFTLRAPSLGIRLSTIGRLTGQLISERLNPARVGRRRTSQIQIAFDLFRKQLELTKPDLGTFFTNHVASSMHRYWPAKFPEDYSETDLGEEWRGTYAHEIDFTMGEADRQLSQLASFVERNANYALVIASSMGQAAVDASQVIRSQLYIQEAGKFMDALGVAEGQWVKHRAMLPRYVFKIVDEKVAAFRRGLTSLTINGEPVQAVELGSGIFQIKLGQANLSDATTVVAVNGERRDLHSMGLENTPIQDETGSYAYHVPHGIFIAYDPSERRGEDRGTISTQDIAPTFLANFGVPRRGYMRPGLKVS